MQTEFDIKISGKDMYRFNLYHSYTGSQGKISIGVAILLIVVAICTRGTVSENYTKAYVVFAVVMLLYLPINLYLRSAQQMLGSPVLQNALHYKIDAQGVHTSQGDAAADLLWEEIHKIVFAKQYVFIYSTRVNAFILPREQMGQQYDVVRQMAEQNLPKSIIMK